LAASLNTASLPGMSGTSEISSISRASSSGSYVAAACAKTALACARSAAALALTACHPAADPPSTMAVTTAAAAVAFPRFLRTILRSRSGCA
jgi:hypothetical protein